MRIGVDASRCFEEQKTGTERYAYEVLTRMLELPEAREHTWILYVRNSPPTPLFTKERGVSVRFVEIPLLVLWTQVGLAARTWMDKLDVLWVPAHTLPVGGKLGLRMIVTIHGLEYEWLPSFKNALQRWYLPFSTWFAVQRASKIIAVSEFTKKELVRKLGAREDNIEVVYEGASQNSKGISQNSNSKVLSRYGLEKKKYILTVGTVQPRKNFQRLIEAFSKISNQEYQISNLKLVIVGKMGWEYEEVLNAPKKYGIADKVVFTEYVSDAKRDVLLQNCLMYVQPSISEGFGLPVIEAMSAGKPVAISNGGALPELVPHPWPIFDPWDLDDMVSKIVAVLSDVQLKQELISRGRKKASEFLWETASKKTYNLLTA